MGSACIYPRNANQPIKEEYLLTDALEPTNEPYAIAKIAGIKLCESYFRQYGDNFISVMPNNLYGPNDNFDLETSHVLPALLRKFHEAKIQNTDFVEVWGSGSPKREFLHVDELADACVYLMNNLDAKQLYGQNISHINIGTGEETTINVLYEKLAAISGIEGPPQYAPAKLGEQLRSVLDNSKAVRELQWRPKTSIDRGLEETFDYFKHQSR